jgi:hypothetical protein
MDGLHGWLDRWDGTWVLYCDGKELKYWGGPLPVEAFPWARLLTRGSFFEDPFCQTDEFEGRTLWG